MKKIYTTSYACLDCRKVFKKPRYEVDGVRTWVSIDHDRVCPECRQGLIEPGMAFKAPKQTDMKAWDKIAPLLRSGYRFNPNFGSPFEEAVPETTAQLKVPNSEFGKPNRKRNKMPNKMLR